MSRTLSPAEVEGLQSNTVVSLEMPGYVAPGSTGETFLEMVGGLRKINQVINSTTKSNPAVMECRLRPKDPHCHPLVSSTLFSNNIVVKMTRKRRRTDPPGSGEVTAEPVAVIPQTYDFTSAMVDFQFLPTPLKTPPVTDILHPEFLSAPEALKVVPLRFVSNRTPHEYGFIEATMRERAEQVIVQPVKFEEELPPIPSEVPTHVKRSPMFAQLSKLFEVRKIWSRGALMKKVPKEQRVWLKMREILSYIAYQFADGPYRCCVVRHGYDPRTLDNRSEGALHQVLEVRIKELQTEDAETITPHRMSLLKIIPVAGSRSLGDDVPERAEPKRETIYRPNEERAPLQNLSYQLVDLKDVTLHTLVTKCMQDLNDCCNVKTGWFTERHYKDLRAELKTQILRQMEDGPNAGDESLRNMSMDENLLPDDSFMPLDDDDSSDDSD